jgi:hypothetical protein
VGADSSSQLAVASERVKLSKNPMTNIPCHMCAMEKTCIAEPPLHTGLLTKSLEIAQIMMYDDSNTDRQIKA